MTSNMKLGFNDALTAKIKIGGDMVDMPIRSVTPQDENSIREYQRGFREGIAIREALEEAGLA